MARDPWSTKVSELLIETSSKESLTSGSIKIIVTWETVNSTDFVAVSSPNIVS